MAKAVAAVTLRPRRADVRRARSSAWPGCRGRRSPSPTSSASVAWIVPIVLLGHWLGHITFIRKYVELLAVAVIIVSVVPALLHMARSRRTPA